MKASKLREKSKEELMDQLQKIKTDLMEEKFKSVVGQLKDTSSLPKKRREIAQIMTILREK